MTNGSEWRIAIGDLKNDQSLFAAMKRGEKR
ncbi:MAG: hypothetical protein KEFWMYNX_000379 [Candidatus Fervidibacter sp.]|jgi:hypothetical protein